MATQFKSTLFGVVSAPEPSDDLRTLHRLALKEMARFQDEMERLEIPAEAIDKFRDAVLIAVEDYRRRYPSDEYLPTCPDAAIEAASPLDQPPVRSPAMRRFLGF